MNRLSYIGIVIAAFFIIAAIIAPVIVTHDPIAQGMAICILGETMTGGCDTRWIGIGETGSYPDEHTRSLTTSAHHACATAASSSKLGAQ